MSISFLPLGKQRTGHYCGISDGEARRTAHTRASLRGSPMRREAVEGIEGICTIAGPILTESTKSPIIRI
jgi:hypothetical protein